MKDSEHYYKFLEDIDIKRELSERHSWVSDMLIKFPAFSSLTLKELKDYLSDRIVEQESKIKEQWNNQFYKK